MAAHSSRTSARTAALTAVAVALLGSVAAPAQDSESNTTNERLRECDAIADTMQKLECFDAVVKSLDDGSQSPPPTAATPAPEKAPAPEAIAPAAAVPAAAAAAAPVAKAPEAERAAPAPAPAPASAPAASTTAASAAAGPAPGAPATAGSAAPPQPIAPEDAFGLNRSELERLGPQGAPAEAEEVDSIQATIVEAWPTIDGRFEARLDNGQVWRETERTRWSLRLPEEGTSVVISKGWFGGYRMKIGDNNRLAAVRRTN